jgi:putative YhgA-like transposase
VNTLKKIHDFDAAWKTILEAFEREVIEVMFPELYPKIDWEKGTESLEQELQEIQKEIFDKQSTEKIISDKIVKVKLKNSESKILFIHVEVQSSSREENIFGERMFRYFYRIWDRFRYKYEDQSEIVAAAIYTYKGERGKDKSYIYKLPDIEEEILKYNFRTIDVETIKLEDISEYNPIRLVFKIAKELLNTKSTDEAIYEAKVKLANELYCYDKVKNEEQNKALVYLLEYLFLIEDPELENKYNEFRKSVGGVLKMTVDEIREKHLKLQAKLESAESLLDILDDETIATKLKLSIDLVKELREKQSNSKENYQVR